jgi:hypothetical protein
MMNRRQNAMDWHNDQTGRNLAAGETPPWTCSETQFQTMADLPPRQKATRGHRQAIAELGLRFQPANAADLEAHRLRLELLASDCAEIAPSLLRDACDMVARDAKGLPYASEILAAARHLVEERQRIQAATERTQYSGPMVQPGDKAGAYRAANLRALQSGARVMQADDGSLFRLGDPGERRGVRGDGSVIEPFFHHRKGDDDTIPQAWFCRQEDAAALARCYAEHGAGYVLRGAMIVERGA